MILIETFRDFWLLLDRKGRAIAGLLVVLLAISGALEIAGMLFLFGYIAALGGVDSANRLQEIAGIYQYFAGGLDGVQFALVAGAVLVAVFAIKNGLWLLSSFAVLRFALKRYEKVATDLFDGFQELPLDYMRSEGTFAPVQILNRVLSVFRNAFAPLLQAGADIAVVLAMLAALVIVIDPVLVISSAIVIGVTALAFLGLTRRLSNSLGERMDTAQLMLRKVTNEALRGLIDVRLTSSQKIMRSRFGRVAGEFALADRRIRGLEMIPRSLNEMVLAIGIAFAASWFAADEAGLAGSLPELAILGFAGLRITSAMSRLTRLIQKMQVTGELRRLMMSSIRKSAPQLLQGDKAETAQRESYRSIDLPLPEGASQHLSDGVTVKNVSFTYPEEQRRAIDGVSLEIKAGSFTALCGESGGGKSTLALIMMGLLRPQEGSVECDDWDIFRHPTAWHSQIGYVGQFPFLSARTVRENVGFGLPIGQIDDDAVWRALEAASLADFFRDHARGLDAYLGQDGASLSGGQRQRVAIARALYRDPAVLVFDEATAALDTVTEREVAQAIARLRGDRTIIAIAHRLSTIESADAIHLLEGGKIAASGTYDELLGASDRFRKLAGMDE